MNTNTNTNLFFHLVESSGAQGLFKCTHGNLNITNIKLVTIISSLCLLSNVFFLFSNIWCFLSFCLTFFTFDCFPYFHILLHFLVFFLTSSSASLSVLPGAEAVRVLWNNFLQIHLIQVNINDSLKYVFKCPCYANWETIFQSCHPSILTFYT